MKTIIIWFLCVVAGGLSYFGWHNVQTINRQNAWLRSNAEYLNLCADFMDKYHKQVCEK